MIEGERLPVIGEKVKILGSWYVVVEITDKWIKVEVQSE